MQAKIRKWNKYNITKTIWNSKCNTNSHHSSGANVLVDIFCIDNTSKDYDILVAELQLVCSIMWREILVLRKYIDLVFKLLSCL